MADESKPGSQVVPRKASVTENLSKSYGLADKLKSAQEQLSAMDANKANRYNNFLARYGKKTSYEDTQKILDDPNASLDRKQWAQKRMEWVTREADAGVRKLRGKVAEGEGAFLSGTERQMYKGAQFAEGLLGEEGLGRLGTDAEVQDTLQRFKDISEQGLSRQEVEAERAAAFQGIDRSTQTSQRALQAALARAGVKGATAGQQLLQGELGGLQAKAGVERDLFLKSEELKRTGLADYSQRLGDVKTFDLAQAASEKDIALQTGLAFAQMKSAKDIAAVQAQAQEAAARARSAAACFHEDVEVKMVTGKYKKISQIKLGEETSMGEVMGVSKYLVEGSELVEVNGNIMTNQHIIFHKGKYILAEEIGKKLNWSGSHVVYDVLIDGHHLLELGNDVLATDQEAMDYDAEAIKDFLNEFTTKVSTGTI